MFIFRTSENIRERRLCIDWASRARFMLSASDVRGSWGVPTRLSKETNLLLKPIEYLASIEKRRYSVYIVQPTPNSVK